MAAKLGGGSSLAPPLQAPVAAPARQGCESCPAEARKCKRGGCPGKQILLQALKRQKGKKKKETTHAWKKPEPTGIAEADPIPAVISRGAQHLPEHPQAQHRAQTEGTQPGARSPHPKALGGLTSAPGHEDLELGTPRCWILPKTSPPPLLTPFFWGNPNFRTRSLPQSSGWVRARDPAPKPGGFQEHNQLVGHKTTACEKPGRLPGASEAAPGWPLSSKWPRSAPPALLSQHSDH